ncbi:unnamed protein product [Closterium sp. NIES-64]|nr:unnamed protein product [Closterium sp. NIES-64]
MTRSALLAFSLALLLVAARAGSPITSSTANEKPDQSSKKDDGLMTEIPAAIAKQAAAGNAEGVTYVDTAQDTFFMADVKKAGWNAQKCPPGLNKELAGACTPKNCSKGGIPAKWKTAYLQKNKLGYELYVPGNPLTLLKANPASCCNTCAATPLCTYWQYIPDITIDGKKGKGACYLIHDQIDFTCGEMTAQYSTETKPVPLQVRIGGECNPSAKILNDPHLVGAHGTHFDFNGRPDKAFCLLTDRDLHVNMLLRGYYDERTDNAALVVDGKAVHTWIKELGIVWTAKGVDHKIRIAARGGKQQERGDGFVKSIEIDGEAIPRMQVGDSVTSDGGLRIQFRVLEKEGPFDVDYYLLTIDGLISLDLRLRVAHPKLQTPSDAEAHINVGIAELEHTDAIHGVLGQTYRDDHAQRAADFQKLIASLHRPISADGAEGQGFLDGTPRSYEASDVLAVDCAYTAYVGQATGPESKVCDPSERGAYATGPESIAWDPSGRGPYVSVSDGRILRRKTDGSDWEEFTYASPHRYRALLPHWYPCCRTGTLAAALVPLLLHRSYGQYHSCQVSSSGGQATKLVDVVDGTRMMMCNDLDIDADANVVYFTDSSSRWARRDFLPLLLEGRKDGRFMKDFLPLLLEGRKDGRFMKYDIGTGKTTVLVSKVAFANGVALSQDKKFVVFCETTYLRCHRKVLDRTQLPQLACNSITYADSNH